MSRPRLARLSSLVRGRALPWAVAGVTAILTLVFGLLWWSGRADDVRRSEVDAAARSFLIALTNFDAATIDRDVQEIRSFAVGQFAQEVEETFSADRLQAIRDNQASSRGRVRSLFVQRLDQDAATVFGVVDETIANATTPQPRMDVLRVEIGLIETTAAWKVDRVEILQSPSGGLVAP